MALKTLMVMVRDEGLVQEGEDHLLWDLQLGASLLGCLWVTTCHTCKCLCLIHLECILGVIILNMQTILKGALDLLLCLRPSDLMFLCLVRSITMQKQKWKSLDALWNTRLKSHSLFLGHLFLLKGCLVIVQVLILRKL